MIPNEVYVEMEILKRQGLSLQRIAAKVGCAVNTMCSHRARVAAPRCERKVTRPSSVRTRRIYVSGKRRRPRIPAMVLLRKIAERGHTGSLSQLRAFMRSPRPTAPA